jgi:hypothetical protein
MRTVALLLATAGIFLASEQAMACKPSVSDPLKVLSEEEKFGLADFVVIGTVLEKQDAPELRKEINQPYLFRITAKVEKWLKGSGAETIEVIDTTGTDCDPLIGVYHLGMEPNPRSTKWRIFIKKYPSRLQVVTADRLK